MFRLDRLRVYSEQDEQGSEWSEATVSVFVADHRELAVSEGVGPVDALSKALNRALCRFYPRLEALRLADCKVRVLTPEEATAASVRVLVEYHDTNSEDIWHTVGVSLNILDASWQALTDGVRYYLLRTKPVVQAEETEAVSACVFRSFFVREINPMNRSDRNQQYPPKAIFNPRLLQEANESMFNKG